VSAEIFAQLHQATEDEFNRAAGTEGWAYRDLPRLTIPFWDDLMARFGEGEVRIMVASRGNFQVVTDDEGNVSSKEAEPWIRASILVSPQGMKNLAASRTPEEQADG
jgi:hypothetical protein